MSRSKYYLFLYFLFILLVLLTPFNSIIDFFLLFKGTLGEKTIVKTPWIFKIYKDILLVFVIFIVLINIKVIIKNRRQTLIYNLFLFILFVFSILGYLQTKNLFPVIIGLRSYSNIFYIFLGIIFYEFRFNKIYKFIVLLLYFEFLIQILQLAFSSPYYGVTLWGFNLRNAGTFIIPSTMAAYALFALFLAEKKKDLFTQWIALLSILLSNSTTAYIIIFIYYSWKILKSITINRRKLSKEIYYFLFFFIIIIFILNIKVLSGRGDDIYTSFSSRVLILQDALKYPLGIGFGLASAASVLLHFKGSVIADSQLNSMIYNFGYLGLIIYLFIFIDIYRVLKKNDGLLFLTLLFFSLTLIVFETSPFIQMTFFYIGIKKGQKIKYEKKNINHYCFPAE